MHGDERPGNVCPVVLVLGIFLPGGWYPERGGTELTVASWRSDGDCSGKKICFVHEFRIYFRVANLAETNSRTRSYLFLRSALKIIIWFPILINRGFL
jgi:hypothetical protein